jgi:glucokinase
MVINGLEAGHLRKGQIGVGVDIGGTKILICLLDQNGKVIYRKKADTTTDFARIYAHVAECLHAASVTMDQVAAIGFGVPGITNSSTGTIVEAPAFQWKNVPFKAQMQRYFDKPVFVNNDVNCAALGEQWQGNAKNIDDFTFITIGTGVGCAIVANGRLVEGHEFMAGEIGYFVTDRDIPAGKRTSLDVFGAFEQKTSGSALSGHGCTAEELFQKYVDGDGKAVVTIDRFIQDLAIGIANIVSLLNPKKIVIGGGVSRSMPVILDSLRSRVAQLTPIPVSIELSELEEEAGAIGAFAYAMTKLGQGESRLNEDPQKSKIM